MSVARKTKYIIPLILLGMVTVIPAQDSRFQWSFENSNSTPGTVMALPIPPEDSGNVSNPPDDFMWSSATSTVKSAAGSAETRNVESQATGGKAYAELLKENLELRTKISEAQKDEEAARIRSQKLANEVKDLESRIAEFAKTITDMKRQQSVPENPDKMVELEEKLAQAEKEKTELVVKLQQLQAAGTAAVPAGPAVTANIKEGSSLYREKEEENRELSRKLAEIEAARKKALEEKEQIAAAGQKAILKAKESEAKLEEYKGKLKQAESSIEQHKQAVKKLYEHMPGMEKELETLRKDASTKETVVSQQEKELEAMKVELERREYRLKKAERMTALLEQTREDIKKEDDKKMRDMYYNMAVVYMKEGKFADAEREFLRALQIDPMDADVHYNLGILYEDHLKKKSRAAMHYRRYLQLRPSAADSDQVKSWLYDIELKP